MAQAIEAENPRVLSTAHTAHTARIAGPAPRYHNPSGMPELWKTVASCFDDMLSARNDLGRPPFEALAAAHSSLTGKHNASTARSPEASITTALPIETPAEFHRSHIAGSSRASMQLPPMPEPLVEDDLDDHTPTLVVSQRRTKRKSHFIEALFQ
jgi:hypothetical protein